MGRLRPTATAMSNVVARPPKIRDCLQHAEDCARQADAQTDPTLKQDFLDTERRWLLLARSYEFTQRLGDFSNETSGKLTNCQRADVKH
jgi:hypothetical protein